MEVGGFGEPEVGEFMQGDSRSGEVEVRATEEGPASVVMVRQLADDDSWWVIGAANCDIDIVQPDGGEEVESPLVLTGSALAFEGTVNVSILADGVAEPIGEGFVTGSGSGEKGPFAGEIPFESPGEGWGTLLLYTVSAEDGGVHTMGAIRIRFGD